MATASFSGNPQSTPKDAIRFLIGDTGPTTFNFTDEEILFALTTEANFWTAASLFADKMALVVSGGGLASKSVGDLSLSYSQTSIGFWLDLAKKLRLRGSGHQVPWIEQISQKFSFKQFDIPGGGQPRVKADQLVAEPEE